MKLNCQSFLNVLMSFLKTLEADFGWSYCFMEIVMYFNLMHNALFHFFQRWPHFKFTYVHKTLCRLMHFTLLSYFVFCKGALILQKIFNFVLFSKKISLNFGLKIKGQWFYTFVLGWNKIERCVMVIEIKERHFSAWNRHNYMMKYVDILTF